MIRRAAALLAVLVVALLSPAVAGAAQGPDCPVQSGSRAEMAASLGLVLTVDGEAVQRLEGNVEPGDGVRAEVSVPADCDRVELTLAAYEASAPTFPSGQQLVESETLLLPGDDGVLDVTAPDGCFQIDLAYGRAIPDPSQNPYGDRLIDFANGGEEPCETVTAPAECPEPGMSPADIRDQLDQDPLLADAAVAGEDVTVAFTIPEGCAPVQLTLAAYEATGPTFPSNQKLVDHETETFTAAGRYDLTVAVPDCFYQVDFAFGPVIEELSEEERYGDRLIDFANGGTEPCEATTPGPPQTTTPGPPQTTTPGPPQTTTPQQPAAPGGETLPDVTTRPNPSVPGGPAPVVPGNQGPSGVVPGAAQPVPAVVAAPGTAAGPDAVLAVTGLPVMLLLPLGVVALIAGTAILRRGRASR